MRKYDALSKAIVDAFVGKIMRIALSMLFILWIMQLFQGMAFQKSTRFIGWSKTIEHPHYKMMRIGDCEVLTLSHKSKSFAIGISLPLINN